MRSLLAFGLVVLLGVGGCTNAPPAPSIRPGTPTATTTTPSGNPSTTSSAEPTPTAVASEPDRYPAELANRPFEIRPFPDGSVTIVGLLGRPERLTLPPGERLLDVVGELAFTAVDAEGGVSVSVWTIPTGDRITGPAFVPGLLGPYGIVAGSYVILVSTDGPQGIASAIRAVSTVDGSVRQIAPGSSPVDLVDPVREVVVSSKGDRVLTTLCATSVDFVGNCRPADLIDIETGEVVGSVDLGGGSLVAMSFDLVLLAWLDHVAVRDLGGHELWSSPSYTGTRFLQQARFLDDRTVFVSVLLTDGSARRRLLLFDANTGESRRLATLATDATSSGFEAPNVINSLSTDRFLAIGTDIPACRFIGFACEPDDRLVIDASILDIATGDLTPGAIHINLAP